MLCFEDVPINETCFVAGLGIHLRRIPDRIVPGVTTDDDRPVNAEVVSSMSARAVCLVDPDTFVARC